MITREIALLSGRALFLKIKELEALGNPENVVLRRSGDELLIYSPDEFQNYLNKGAEGLYGLQKRRYMRAASCHFRECSISGKTITIPQEIMKGEENVRSEGKSLFPKMTRGKGKVPDLARNSRQ